MKVFLKCDEANHTCDKTQYNEASLWEKICLNIHLIYCAACRKYTKRNAKLTKAFKESKVKTMPRNDKEKIKKVLSQEL